MEICQLVRKHKQFFKAASDKHDRNVRHKNRLVMPTSIRSMIFDKCTCVAAVRIYNRIPINIKIENDVRFKRLLQNWLIDNVFYSLSEYYAATKEN